jgi:hypothetical protein
MKTLCMGCKKILIDVPLDYEVEFCCLGQNCCCLGKPINPLFCDFCEDLLTRKEIENE